MRYVVSLIFHGEERSIVHCIKYTVYIQSSKKCVSNPLRIYPSVKLYEQMAISKKKQGEIE